MKGVTVDASVVVKWLFPQRDEEDHKNEALRLLGDLQDGRCSILQPPHWLAETCAVAARLDLATAKRAGELLWAMECPVLDTLEVYSLGMELAAALNHHLFDTLYHAVALCEPDTLLVTADERYYLKAKHKGNIILLSEYNMH
jgi:predicted nucleic acid-binding protein